jgi:hypothetical protein
MKMMMIIHWTVTMKMIGEKSCMYICCAFKLAYVERPEVSVLLAVKHDYEILYANNIRLRSVKGHIN